MCFQTATNRSDELSQEIQSWDHLESDVESQNEDENEDEIEDEEEEKVVGMYNYLVKCLNHVLERYGEEPLELDGAGLRNLPTEDRVRVFGYVSRVRQEGGGGDEENKGDTEVDIMETRFILLVDRLGLI
jgi:hypothetical protein